VEGRAVVIAFKIALGERQVTESVRSVNDDEDTALPAEFADLPDRQNLSVQEDDVADENEAGARRDGRCDSRHDLLAAMRHDRYLNLFHHDAVSSHALHDCVDHSWIVLGGRQHLVSRFEFEAEQTDFECLACVACNSNLFSVTAKVPCEAAAHRSRAESLNAANPSPESNGWRRLITSTILPRNDKSLQTKKSELAETSSRHSASVSGMQHHLVRRRTTKAASPAPTASSVAGSGTTLTVRMYGPSCLCSPRNWRSP